MLKAKSTIKGTLTQNIFSLKSGPKGSKGLYNNNDLQKKLENSEEILV